ncbi:conserved unknown protein [Ectocarpus siliculosus]|uniref:Topoisomerase I C-terminal domain-containing protein n=1 Tax=Ectocarpus siliculosus TaxID=2880 RepID=D7G047_ECTSI|nr:conserved unknown protein [Ectocarpus siliculosus]|eukprot:CBJ32929.1 conserved unknown protein [Ectocarpus siliculosus]
MDPRMSVAWCKRHEVPVEKVFAKTLQNKFVWAMNVPPDWNFSYETLYNSKQSVLDVPRPPGGGKKKADAAAATATAKTPPKTAAAAAAAKKPAAAAASASAASPKNPEVKGKGKAKKVEERR